MQGNGSAAEPIRRGRGLAIIDELASSLGGHIHTSCAAEGSYFLLTFPLTEAEQRAAGAAHVVKLKRRKVRRPQQLQASGSEDPGVSDGGKLRARSSWNDWISQTDRILQL